MIRTIIINIEADDGQTIENAEDALLQHCNALARRYSCSVDANICAQPLAQTLIDSLCNPPVPTVPGYTSRGARLLQAVTARQRAKAGK